MSGRKDVPFLDWRLDGEEGDDRLVSELGAFLFGGPGDDRISVRGSGSSGDGGSGDDVVEGGSGGDYLGGGAGDDVLRGGSGRDVLGGGDIVLLAEDLPQEVPAGRDRLDGGPDDDQLFDGDASGIEEVGPDVVVGGTGDDSVSSYGARRRGVRVDLSRPGGDGERGEGDRLSGVENVVGGARADRLTGDGDANRLEGGAGADVLRGRGGDDRLVMEGADRVSGDRGDDVLQSPLSFDGRLPCGPGRDRVVLASIYLLRGVPRGPLIGPDCEHLLIPHRDLSLVPRPTQAAGGRLVFRILGFRCCGFHLTLTRDAPGFPALGRSWIDRERVVIAPARAAGGATLRAVVSGRYGVTARWRFPAPGR